MRRRETHKPSLDWTAQACQGCGGRNPGSGPKHPTPGSTISPPNRNPSSPPGTAFPTPSCESYGHGINSFGNGEWPHELREQLPAVGSDVKVPGSGGEGPQPYNRLRSGEGSWPKPGSNAESEPRTEPPPPSCFFGQREFLNRDRMNHFRKKPINNSYNDCVTIRGWQSSYKVQGNVGP